MSSTRPRPLDDDEPTLVDAHPAFPECDDTGVHVVAPTLPCPPANDTAVRPTKYVPGRPLRDVAADIRQELKDLAAKDGLLHGVECRVRFTRSRTSHSITATVVGLPAGLFIINVRWVEQRATLRAGEYIESMLTRRGQAILDEIERVMEQHNHPRSPIFYGHVEYDGSIRVPQLRALGWEE